MLLRAQGNGAYKVSTQNFVFIDFGEREKHQFALPLIYAFHWLLLVCARTRGRTCSLGVSELCCKQLSSLARTKSAHF